MVKAAAKAGFIGLGVMGEPICTNMARKTNASFTAYDMKPAPLERVAAWGVQAATSAMEVVECSDIVFLSLPGGPEVEAVCGGAGGLLAHIRPGTIVVDMSTTPVGLTRKLATAFAQMSARFVDAPVARTRQAALDGTLSIMVGADRESFNTIRPFLDAAASEVTLCGEVGCGQVVKILNNMVLFQTVVALAEAMSIAKEAGVDESLLLETLSKGSADSFALRNHGMKAMAPRRFPEDAFPTDYAIKDISYALDLSEQTGIDAQGAALAQRMLERSRASGNGNSYFPALIRIVEKGGGEAD
jgi:3-hydroxyisobutyrate dehydrogenase-like beta-hydroxyacid dehydrogenase